MLLSIPVTRSPSYPDTNNAPQKVNTTYYPGPAQLNDNGTGDPTAVNETHTTSCLASCTNTVPCRPVNPIAVLSFNLAATVLTKLHGMRAVMLKKRSSNPPYWKRTMFPGMPWKRAGVPAERVGGKEEESRRMRV